MKKLSDTFLKFALGLRRNDVFLCAIDDNDRLPDLKTAVVYPNKIEAEKSMDRVNRVLGLNQNHRGEWQALDKWDELNGGGGYVHPYKIYSPEQMFDTMRQGGLDTVGILLTFMKSRAYWHRDELGAFTTDRGWNVNGAIRHPRLALRAV